jgi:hypothetical protein
VSRRREVVSTDGQAGHGRRDTDTNGTDGTDGGVDVTRAVDPAAAPVEAAEEVGLRPRRLVEFVGQSQLKEHLEIVLEASRRRREAVDHLLFRRWSAAAIWRPSSPTWPKVTSSSSTRSTGWRGRWRRSCTRPWRTSSSTS